MATVDFMVDLYNQLTTGNEEFFGTGNLAVPGSTRNPLSLDELTSFSRRLTFVGHCIYSL
jgi:hypothetical protein